MAFPATSLAKSSSCSERVTVRVSWVEGKGGSDGEVRTSWFVSAALGNLALILEINMPGVLVAGGVLQDKGKDAGGLFDGGGAFIGGRLEGGLDGVKGLGGGEGIWGG